MERSVCKSRYSCVCGSRGGSSSLQTKVYLSLNYTALSVTPEGLCVTGKAHSCT